jgi:hypothetical protein
MKKFKSEAGVVAPLLREDGREAEGAVGAVAVARFDPETEAYLAARAATVRENWPAFETKADEAAPYYWRTCEALAQAHARIKASGDRKRGGGFKGWVERECPHSLSREHATRMVRTYHEFKDVDPQTRACIRHTAMVEPAKPSSREVMEEALSRAAAGERITPGKVADMKGRRQGPPIEEAEAEDVSDGAPWEGGGEPGRRPDNRRARTEGKARANGARDFRTSWGVVCVKPLRRSSGLDQEGRRRALQEAIAMNERNEAGAERQRRVVLPDRIVPGEVGEARRAEDEAGAERPDLYPGEVGCMGDEAGAERPDHAAP